MKTKIYKTSTVLIIVFANLLISSLIFAQVKPITKESTLKTDTKKATVNPITKNATLKTDTKKATVNEQIQIKQLYTPAYSVGDFAHGGIVFFVDNTGEHGLVCAKTDQSTSASWSAGVNIETRANAEGLFQGMNNSEAIINIQGNIDGSTYAARICRELVITEGDITYSDWYLPSKDELHLMFENRAIINTTATANGGSAIPLGYYWSSTEYSRSEAWWEYSSGTWQKNDHKAGVHCVRAVRRF